MLPPEVGLNSEGVECYNVRDVKKEPADACAFENLSVLPL